MDETTIYEAQGVKITNLRAVLGNKTYSVSNITSVGTTVKQPGSCLPFGLMAFGVLLILGGVVVLAGGAEFTTALPWFGFGGLSLAVGLLVHRGGKSAYIVRLGSASGEADALESTNKADIDSIVSALNEAIVRKG